MPPPRSYLMAGGLLIFESFLVKILGSLFNVRYRDFLT